MNGIFEYRPPISSQQYVPTVDTVGDSPGRETRTRVSTRVSREYVRTVVLRGLLGTRTRMSSARSDAIYPAYPPYPATPPSPLSKTLSRPARFGCARRSALPPCRVRTELWLRRRAKRR